MKSEHKKIVEDLQRQVRDNWSQEDKDYFFLTNWENRSLAAFHHSFGRYIRNTYKLWEVEWEPEIVNEVDCSPNHPDQISMDIIKELWKRGLKEAEEIK